MGLLNIRLGCTERLLHDSEHFHLKCDPDLQLLSCACASFLSAVSMNTLDKEMSPQITQHWNTGSTCSSSNCHTIHHCRQKVLSSFMQLGVMTCLVTLTFGCSDKNVSNYQAKTKHNCPCNEITLFGVITS